MTTNILPTPPAGYTLTIEGDTIVIHGNFSEDLHARIKRAGGVWDGKNGGNRRVWLIPADKASSLKRIFANWVKAAAESAVAADRAEAVRWLGFVEQKAREGWLYDKGLEKLQSLNVRQWPDLGTRLDAAKAAAEAVQKRLAAQRAQEAEARQQQRQQQAATRAARVLVALSHRPALNAATRWYGQTVVFTGFGKSFRISEDAPSYSGSHLLGCEGEQGCYAYYRQASADEIAALESAERAEQERIAAEQAAEIARNAARDEIVANGERPAGKQQPTGEIVASTQTIYGGGDWFVVGPDWIWYVQNNGMDGDDWSRNNIITGGAGAIGWRVPYTADLAARIGGLSVRRPAS